MGGSKLKCAPPRGGCYTMQHAILLGCNSWSISWIARCGTATARVCRLCHPVPVVSQSIVSFATKPHPLLMRPNWPSSLTSYLWCFLLALGCHLLGKHWCIVYVVGLGCSLIEGQFMASSNWSFLSLACHRINLVESASTSARHFFPPQATFVASASPVHPTDE